MLTQSSDVQNDLLKKSVKNSLFIYKSSEVIKMIKGRKGIKNIKTLGNQFRSVWWDCFIILQYVFIDVSAF